MRRGKTKSDITIAKSTSELQTTLPPQIEEIPLDVLRIKIQNLRTPDEPSKKYALKAVFSDQLLISAIIESVGHRDVAVDKTLAEGNMNYDPSDYEKMSYFADNPLTVNIQPLDNIKANILYDEIPPEIDSNSSQTKPAPNLEISCCNIDILPLFIDKDKLELKQKMQPIIKRSARYGKSWDNLPIISVEISVYRHPENVNHHKILQSANFINFTLIGGFNMIIPYSDDFLYTAATLMPISSEQNCSPFSFNRGTKVTRKSNFMNFYQNWESLRATDDLFTMSDSKLSLRLEDFYNDDKLDLNYYVNEIVKEYTTLWTSFHRTLFLKDTEVWLSKQIRRYKWPLEVHLYGDNCSHSFMGFIDLFKLLYNGETEARVVVPLQWLNNDLMMETCGYQTLLAPAEKPCSAIGTPTKSSKMTNSGSASLNTDIPRATGSDDNPAFVLIQVKLNRPFKQPVIPPYITTAEIDKMLDEMDAVPSKRECSGRGQLDRDWLSTVRTANNSLRRVPYYGTTDFYIINRQLSGTRTRVEIHTSLWQEAAIYVNNNFVVSNFLESEEKFEEMTMMAHSLLMRMTCDFLTNVEMEYSLDPTLRAARHARQLRDIPHAIQLLLQAVSQNLADANLWRELSTCLKEVDVEWANVCLNKSISIDPRHPLSILSKGCMVFDENPNEAEPFFVSLLGLYPFYKTLWIIASAYYWRLEYYNMAHEIIRYARDIEAKGLAQEMKYPRVWERELGEWWDQTTLTLGSTPFYDACDLLLRLRAISLAELCLARALSEVGETPVYYHLLALCCRLRGNVDVALCHLNEAIKKFGDVSYLKSLEGECYHKKKDYHNSAAAFEKAGSSISAYSNLLSLPRREQQRITAILTDLIRRQPSAYAWMYLADDWLSRSTVGEGGDAGKTDEQKSATACAIACAAQALKLDRQAGRAWALLSTVVKPSARRLHCENMAKLCGYKRRSEDQKKNFSTDSQQSSCYRLGKALRECRCDMCDHLSL